MTQLLWWIDVTVADVAHQHPYPGSVLLHATPEEAGTKDEDAERLVRGRQVQPPNGHVYITFPGPATQVDDTEEAQQYLNRLLTDERNAAARVVGLPYVPDEDETNED
ncbi:MAG TPA: hypothetical protein VGH89_29015 [Pseudonocardia sp.]